MTSSERLGSLAGKDSKDRFSGQRSQQNGHVWLARAATQHYVLPFPQGEKIAPSNRTKSKSPQLSHKTSGPGHNLIYILRSVTWAQQHCLLNNDQPPKSRKIFLGSSALVERKYTPLKSLSPPLSPSQLTGWWVMGDHKRSFTTGMFIWLFWSLAQPISQILTQPLFFTLPQVDHSSAWIRHLDLQRPHFDLHTP